MERGETEKITRQTYRFSPGEVRKAICDYMDAHCNVVLPPVWGLSLNEDGSAKVISEFQERPKP